jgi:hypothetical protein
MTRTEVITNIKKATEKTISLYRSYGKQIKVCNSANSTEEDFDLLTKIKADWHEASLEATRFETQLSNFYYKK